MRKYVKEAMFNFYNALRQSYIYQKDAFNASLFDVSFAFNADLIQEQTQKSTLNVPKEESLW